MKCYQCAYDDGISDSVKLSLCSRCYQKNQTMFRFFQSGGKLPDFMESIPHKQGDIDVVTIGGIQLLVDERDDR